MEILVWLLMALVLIPVCHGIWVGLAKLFSALSGEFGDPNDHAFGRLYGQACRFCGESMRPFEDRCPRCGLARAAARDAADLRATSRHLREFLDEGLLDQKRFQLLRNRIEARHRTLTGQPLEPIPPATPARAAVGSPQPLPAIPKRRRSETEELLEVLPVLETPVLTGAVQKAPLREIALPQTPSEPPAPRRTLTEWLSAFMEERNILWGELIGGLLMVGCSIALVISLWQTLEKIEYFPFLAVAAMTTALFGMGHYTLHRWKLPSTSRGLLVIATLLVPLNFTVLAGLSLGSDGGFGEIAAKIVAVAGFAWLVYRAGRVLLPGEDADAPPRRRWSSLLLPVAVVATPISQLSVVRFMTAQEVGPWFVGLAAWPVAFHALGVGGFLARQAVRRPSKNCGALLGFLGLAAFALLLSLGFIGFWTVLKGACPRQEVLEHLAVPLALAAVPTLLSGLFVRYRTLDAEKGSKDSRLLLAGTGVALVGMLVMVASLLLAWPNPVVLLFVCLLDFAVFTAVAFLFRLPVAHAPALVCLTVGYLAAYHLGAGHLAQVPRDDWPIKLASLAIEGPNAYVLAVLFALVVAAAEGLRWKRLPADSLVYGVGGCVIALVSLLIAVEAGFLEPTPAQAQFLETAAGRASIIFGFFAVSAWAVGWHWTWKWLDHVGVTLILGAVLWALQGRWPGEYPLWGFVLAAAALSLSVLVRKWWPEVAAASLLALIALVAPPIREASGWHTLSLFSLSATAFVQAARARRASLSWLGSGLLLVGIAHALLLRFAGPELPVPLLLTLLIHASIIQAAGFYIRLRRPQDVKTFSVPLGQSVLFPLLLAIPVLLFAIERQELAYRALYASWLAGLWLAHTLIERRPRFFPVFQGVLTVAVLFGVAKWLAGQPWVVDDYPLGLFDPRSLQAFGIALTGLSMLWGVTRLTLRARPSAMALLDAVTPSVDRVVLGGLIIGQAALAIWGLAPGLVREMAPKQAELSLSAWSALAHPVSGVGGWLLWMGLALTLVIWLWEARTTFRLTALVLGLLLLALTAPVLVAGQFSGDAAAASALRWGLAACFLAGSLPLWLRTPIAREAVRFGIHPGNAWTAQLVRGGLLAFAALPVIALSVWMAVLVFIGLTPGGPSEGSFFFRAGDFTSHLFPLSLVLFGLTGHALREWSEEDAFAGGVVTLLIVMGGYALSVIQGGESLVWNDWVILLQAGTVAAALWALGWMEVVSRVPRGFFGATRRHTSPLPSGSLMRVQVLLPVLGNLILVLLGLPRLLSAPADRHVLNLLVPLGNVGGWLAFTIGLLAVLVYARRFRAAWEPHVWGAAMLGLGILAACVSARWDHQNWLAYHTLMTVWTLAACGTGLSGRWSIHAAKPWEGQFTLWIRVLGGLVVALALRTAWQDPARPYFSSAAILAVALLAGVLAMRRRQLLDVILTAALLDLAAVLAWIPLGPATAMSFLCVNVLCAALASIAWTAVERIRIATRPPSESITTGPPALDFSRPFRHGAALGGAAALAAIALIGFFSMAAPVSTPVNDALGWVTWSAVVLAVGLCLWDAGARFPLPALYASGLTAIVILLQGGEGTLSLLARVSMLLLAGYVLLTTIVACVARARESWLQSLRLPWPLPTSKNWFLPAQAGVGALVLALGLGVTLVLDGMSERFMGPLAVGVLILAGVFLPGFAVDSHRRTLRVATLLLGVLMLIEIGWALFDPSVNAIVLHRSVSVLIALAVGTAVCGFGLHRLLPESIWSTEGRRLAPMLGLAASSVVPLVLLLEGLAFDVATKHTPLSWLEILTVLAALAGLATAGIAFAVVPWADPFHLSERRRPYFVYAAELMLVFLFLHLRLNVPELFRLINVEYWTFCVMFVAFAGVGLSEFFHRRKLHVLASPLQRTGVFLPLLPLLAFWLNPPDALRTPLLRVLPGIDAILSRFQGIPGFTLDRYAVLWFLLGMLYACLAVSRRSFRFALAASLAANFGVWVLLQGHGPSLLAHPQIWLIPLALIVLVSEVINRERLSRELSTGLRYLGLGLLYVSSTADLFIAHLNDPVLAIVLAVLSVLGVLAGILFRVRSYLYLGVAFLVLDIFSMIWHAAVDLSQAWVWWASGIVLGAAILALFAFFEKRRQHVLHLVEDFRTWR
jgi:hypothetical protein